MSNTNYISSIVKILETPEYLLLKNNISTSEFRVQLPQVRNNTSKIVNLVFWGNLARDVAAYYQINDYIIVEGYLSLSNKRNLKKVEIIVLKVYPFLLSYNSSVRKI